MSVTHGHRGDRFSSPTYNSWKGMRQRCTYSRHPFYRLYGGRGITVCDRWRFFSNFLADMGERPAGMTLDRIDVNGNYEPSNCRWATPAQQFWNRRTMLQAHGEIALAEMYASVQAGAQSPQTVELARSGMPF